MSDKPETLAAILAEMRAAGRSDEHADGPLIESYASRIEAAAERERNAHTNDIHDALYKATGIPGNAAALREALEGCMHEMCERCDSYMADNMQSHKPCPGCVIVDKAHAALAAPARNCDRFATELDARLAWKRETHCKGDYRYWLFDPAEGGDHA